MSHVPTSAPNLFRRVTELDSMLPPAVWAVLRGLTLLSTLALIATLVLRPELGLVLLWGLAVPLLPLVFVLAPGVWRNVCPLSASNQAPRRLGLTLDSSRRELAQGLAYPVGLVLLVGLIIGRKLVFDQSGVASAGLIAGLLLAALLGGVLFKGKSGWCSSICPLLPVQRLLGQTPYLTVASTQCTPCVGCAKNCYDAAPGIATLADHYDAEPGYRNYRRWFAMMFPGLVLGYFMVPDLAPALGQAVPAPMVAGLPVAHTGAAALIAGQMLLFMGASLLLLRLLEQLIGGARNLVPVLGAALGITIYYAFAAPAWADTLHGLVGALGWRTGEQVGTVWVDLIRAAVMAITVVWVRRSMQAEQAFVREMVEPTGRQMSSPAAMLMPTSLATTGLHSFAGAPGRGHRGVATGPGPFDRADDQAGQPADEQVDDRATDRAFDRAGGTTTPGTPSNATTSDFTGLESTAPAQGVAAANTLPAALGVAVDRAVPHPATATPHTGRAELHIAPEGRRAPLHIGKTLLDALESCGAAVQPGCRSGQCGADAVHIHSGAACLGAMGPDERATLARLGHGDNVRLACVTRVRKAGLVAIELLNAGTVPEAGVATGMAVDGGKPGAVAAPGGRSGAVGNWAPSRRLLAQARPTWDAGIRRVVIVGNGIAGLTAAETLRAHHPQCEIHLIGREKQASYLRTAVTGLISQRHQLSELALRPDAWYAEQRIHCWLNTRATELDTDHQTLTLASSEALRYDRLILAMGANAWVPQSLDGFGVPGSFVLRSAADALALRAFVQRYGARRAVVLGAGLLGIETADALHQMGLAVHLLAQGDQVMEHRLDRDAAALVAAQLRHIGIKVSTHAQLRSLHRSGSERLSRVRLTSGQVIEAELLVVCTGARADITLAEAAGIAVDRGVLVDEHLRSSAAGVYACGDVAQTATALPGLWAPAAEQGRIAALNALGLVTRYEHQVPVVTLKLTGLHVRSAGQLHAEGPGQIELCHRPPTAANRPAPPGAPDTPARALTHFHTAERYTKVVVEIDAKGREHVLGAIVVGDDPDGDDILAAACAGASSSSLGATLMQRPWQRQRGELIEPRPHSLTPARPVPHDEPAGVESAPPRKPRRVA
ncbi:MAG: FAD-dependent oxidoreductase [Burkholderiales bacterium]|nr:FAD-dependent oxidoreductase [Burkholderiales bacterium]